MLTAITTRIAQWDEATARPAYRYIGVLLGLLLFAVLLALPTPAGLSPQAHSTAAVTTLMAMWWVGRVLPMAITALIPVVAFPLLGVLSVADAAMAFAHPLNVLMFGGFIIGHAMEEAGLHHRLVDALLRPAFIRAAPARVVLALMVACAVLSGLVSNTATMLMLLPVALALARLCTDDARQRSAFILGLAYAGSLGGLTTLIGTPPNAVLAGLIPEVTFARWTVFAVPFVALAVPFAWWVVTRVALPLPRTFEQTPKAPPLEPWSLAEGLIVALIALAMLGWFTRTPIPLGSVTIPGWSTAFPPKWTADALVALAVVLLLFLVPALPEGRRAHPGRFLLTVPRMDKSIPWSVLILLGGGFSLAAAFKATALTEWLAGATSSLAVIQGSFGEGSMVGLMLAVLGVSLFMTFATEVTSNTATSQIMLPILAAGAVSAGVEPLMWTVPATVSASCAFMMPVATPPNAIASQAGDVSPADMAWAGLLLNLGLAVLVMVWTVLWAPVVFGL